MRGVGRRVPARMRISHPVRLDSLVQQQVREVWWRQVRLGNRLPPELYLIVIRGGRP